LDAALVAAREEGRREGEAAGSVAKREAELWRNQYNDLRASVEALLAHESAAHAAQLVALREGVEEWIAKTIGPRDAQRLYSDCKRGIIPLPDAEAALEKVREEAVRDFLAKEPSGRHRAIPQRCGVWWTFGDDVVSEDVALTEAEARAVANALNALGGGA